MKLILIRKIDYFKNKTLLFITSKDFLVTPPPPFFTSLFTMLLVLIIDINYFINFQQQIIIQVVTILFLDFLCLRLNNKDVISKLFWEN